MSNWVSKLRGSGAPAVHTSQLLCPCMPPHSWTHTPPMPCPHACSSAYGHALYTPTLPQQAHPHAHSPIHFHMPPHAHPSVPPCMHIHLAHEASFGHWFSFFFFLLYLSDEYGEKESISYSGEATRFWLFLFIFLR